MESIADLIMNQMAQAGKPRTTTSTITAPNEPLDLGSLGLLLFMLLQQNKAGAAGQQGPSDFALSQLTPQLPTLPQPGLATGGTPSSFATGQMNPMQLMMAILGGLPK